MSSPKPSEDSATVLNAFLAHNPNGNYTFDSERDSPQSEICRQNGGGRDCITIQMSSRQLFEAMQKHGFFCALPIDPGRTHMECKPMPK